ncbi:MAG: hypothetical protein ACTSQP_04485 [Promethearchaeota archaeon]
MSDSEKDKLEELENLIKKIDGNVSNLVSILEKFGLDLITKLGKNTSKLNILTEKVEDLYKTILDIKAFLPKMNKIIENQDKIKTEVELLKSLIQRTRMNKNVIKEDIALSDHKKNVEQLIRDKLNEVLTKLDIINSVKDLRENLENVKTEIFEITGGHKLLYEILKVIKDLKDESQPLEKLKDNIKTKVEFWLNKI